ncbi:hypothetical protein FOCC_FOCC011110 [Frankliniella occidentalis]|nr:hypothetical protein FOCC_FOCC011110 [Frankliniella occidentalis]
MPYSFTVIHLLSSSLYALFNIMGSFVPFIGHLKEICRLFSENKSILNVPESDGTLNNRLGTVSKCSVLKDSEQIQSKNTTEQFRNKLCNKLNFSEWKLLLHINYCHMNPVIKYPIVCCGKEFKSSSTYRSHRKTLLHQGLELCRFCSKVLKKDDLEMHKFEVHRFIGEKWICEHCNKHFHSTTTFNEHSNKFHKENTFQCSMCASTLYSSESFEKHLDDAHRSSKSEDFISKPGTMKCCGKVLTQAGYNQHIKSLDHQGLAFCQLCQKSFVKEDLKKHKAEVHNITGGKVKCEVCNKFFTTKQTLAVHIKSVHQKHVYLCKICGKKLSSNRSRERHYKNKHH